MGVASGSPEPTGPLQGGGPVAPSCCVGPWDSGPVLVSWDSGGGSGMLFLASQVPRGHLTSLSLMALPEEWG